MTDGLKGLRILVVEDEFLVALEIERMMADLGCRIVGPVSGVEDALALARTETIDGGILDVNVGGERIDPVAQALIARAIPFILSTGYTSSGISPELRDRPRLSKPFDDGQLAELMRQVFVSGA